MAFGSTSKIFRAGLADMLGNVAQLDVDGTDVLKAALYGNTGTPDQNVTAANSAYNVDQWVTANEVYQAGQWAQGGVALSSITLDRSVSATVFLSAANTASGSAATLANIYGALVYDATVTTPVANQGVCFSAFGGSQSVTNGTFTIVWAATGIMRFTI